MLVKKIQSYQRVVYRRLLNPKKNHSLDTLEESLAEYLSCGYEFSLNKLFSK